MLWCLFGTLHASKTHLSVYMGEKIGRKRCCLAVAIGAALLYHPPNLFIKDHMYVICINSDFYMLIIYIVNLGMCWRFKLPSCLHSKCPTDWTISDVLGCQYALALRSHSGEHHAPLCVFVLDTELKNDRVGYRVHLKLSIYIPTSRVRMGSLPPSVKGPLLLPWRTVAASF